MCELIGYTDFSTSLTKRKTAQHYPTVLPETTVYELLPRGYSTSRTKGAAQEEEETPSARLRRLRYELDEVEMDIEAEKTTEESEMNPPPAALLNQLKLLKGDLSRLSEVATQKQPAETVHASSRTPSPLPPIQQKHSSIAELSSQLSTLESVLGPTLPLNETSTQPLLTTISKLETQLSLLTQPRHLDTLARRIKLLVSDLDRLHETRRQLGDTRPLRIALTSGINVVTPGTSDQPSTTTEDLPPDVANRLTTLFETLPRLQPLLPLAPAVLLRLKSLSSLHSSASNFSTDLSDLTGRTKRLVELADGLKEVLGRVEDGLERNSKVVQGNFDSLRERCGKVAEGVKAL